MSIPWCWRSSWYEYYVCFTIVVEQLNKCFDVAAQSFTVNDHQATAKKWVCFALASECVYVMVLVCFTLASECVYVMVLVCFTLASEYVYIMVLVGGSGYNHWFSTPCNGGISVAWFFFHIMHSVTCIATNHLYSIRITYPIAEEWVRRGSASHGPDLYVY